MNKLKKDITITGLTMIVIGSCIGSGIFITPSGTFKHLPHHGYVVLAWLLGGLVTYLGVMTFSELSSRFPHVGGVYVFLREAYGDIAGFLYGWIILLIVNTGAIAALSVVLTDFLGFFIEMDTFVKRILAISTIVFLTIINVLGVNISDIFAKVFTGLKLLALFSIVLLGIVIFGMDSPSPSPSPVLNFNFTDVPNNLISSLLLAFVGVFWSFGGWHHATYLAEETKNPKSAVPKAMLYGTLTVTIVYVLVILAYSMLLPIDQIISSERVAGDAVANVLKGGGKLVAIGISISIFGTIGIYTMSAPRIYYAMAKDGVFFKSLAKVHGKYGTPYVAMIFQAIWAILLIIVFQNFHNLMTFATFMDIIFMALTTSTIFIFRNRISNDIPTYKLKWYPLIPIIYLVFTVAFVINTVMTLNRESLIGLLILFLGIPVYYYFRRNNKSVKK